MHDILSFEAIRDKIAKFSKIAKLYSKFSGSKIYLGKTQNLKSIFYAHTRTERFENFRMIPLMGPKGVRQNTKVCLFFSIFLVIVKLSAPE